VSNISRASPLYAITFAILHLTAVNHNLTLFTYHSRLGELGWLAQPQKLGPGMYWYGWIVVSRIGATVIAAVSFAITKLLGEFVWPATAVAVGIRGVAVFIARGPNGAGISLSAFRSRLP